MKKFKTRLLVVGLIAFVSSLLSSCIPLAAGAAGGYIMHKKGYRLQSPVKKREESVPRAEVIVPER